jgi:polyvinyl alcohol dehydrogenase (cytochrome)
MGIRSITLPLLAGAALAAAPAGALADVAGCAPASAGGDWPVYGGTLDSHRAQSAEKAISPANVSKLALAWKVAMPDGGKIQSVPTEADGCVFTGTDIGGIVAVNAATGKIVWQKALNSGSGSSAFVGAGLIGAPAISNGIVYIGLTASDGSYELALDEATGATIWKTLIDNGKGGGADSSPVPFDTGAGPKILQGYQGDESGPNSNPGYVILDATTGAIDISRKMISGADYAAGDRGGSITTTPAIDPVRKLAFTGTGNPASEHRNPVTDSQIAIDLDPTHATYGDIVDKVQGDSESYPIPGDNDPPTCQHSIQWPASIFSCLQFDMDFLSSGNLYTASNGHEYFAELQKSGVVHTIDTSVTPMKSVWTATLGPPCLGCNLSSTATDGKSVFVATTDGNLFSLNGDTGGVNWAAPLTGTYHFNGLSTANGVVYDLNDAGLLEAFNASSGQPLFARVLGQDSGTTTADGENSSGISIARDTVFVPSNSQSGGGSTLFAYKLGDGGGLTLPSPPPLPGPPGGAGNGGQVVTAAGAQNYGYATPVVVMSHGGTLTYTNLDPVQHNVVSDAGLFRSEFAGLGQSVTVTGADKLPPGQYGFYCSLHTGMRGTLIVQ